jgi:hypothetical protein
MQEYANQRGVGIVGDIPIYVGGQSADVWANQQLFELNGGHHSLSTASECTLSEDPYV